MQFKLVKDVIPKYMITPTDYRFVADELYALGKDLPSTKLCEILNSINNQGITDVSISHQTYCIGGKVLSFNCLATSEVLFLLSYIACAVNFHIMVYRYDRQLSNRVLKLYLRTFGNTDYVSMLFDNDSCIAYYYGRDLCLL